MKSQLPLHFIRLIPLALLLCLSSALGLNLEVEKVHVQHQRVPSNSVEFLLENAREYVTPPQHVLAKRATTLPKTAAPKVTGGGGSVATVTQYRYGPTTTRYPSNRSSSSFSKKDAIITGVVLGIFGLVLLFVLIHILKRKLRARKERAAGSGSDAMQEKDVEEVGDSEEADDENSVQKVTMHDLQGQGYRNEGYSPPPAGAKAGAERDDVVPTTHESALGYDPENNHQSRNDPRPLATLPWPAPEEASSLPAGGAISMPVPQVQLSDKD